jgi:hypothetical protein
LPCKYNQHFESGLLLGSFYEQLAHTRWGFDPLVHNFLFVHSQSAFLFTSILAASALFQPSGAALAKRLQNHRDFLARQVMAKRLRSVEIVLAFLVNVPWMSPGTHSADDDTGLYISTAISIALDLSLNKIVTPSSFLDRDELKRVPRADCIDAKKALAMDGFEDVPTDSEWGIRLLRRRERAWIALFVLERGVCLARGRSYSMSITPLISRCDKWHAVSITDSRDAAVLSMAVLRRDLDDLFSSVRRRCDGYRVIDIGSKVAQEIETTIHSFYDHWLTTWVNAIGEGQRKLLPPYVDILVTHTRLSTYCGVINHPTAPLEVKRQFRASALSSALNVMRAAIQGETRLKSMPNNTVIMICFAACIALKLSTPPPGRNLSLSPNVRNLVEEVAAVLERIGGIPHHRNGTSVLYGKYLREILKQLSIPGQAPSQSIDPTLAQDTRPVPTREFNLLTTIHSTIDQTSYPPQHGLMEPLQFSAMSDNEIIEAVLNAGPYFNTMLPGIGEDADFMYQNWMDPPEFGF